MSESSQPAQVGSNDGLGVVAEAKKPIAYLQWSLTVDCPKCNHYNDLATSKHDCENTIARHIFHNDWHKLQDWEVTCEGCGHEFQIDSVVY